MKQPLQGKRLLLLVGEIYEDLELWYPRLRMIEAGAEVIVAGPEGRQKYVGKHGYPCVSDAAISEVSADAFNGLIVPGGFMPDQLRRDARVKELVRAFDAAGSIAVSFGSTTTAAVACEPRFQRRGIPGQLFKSILKVVPGAVRVPHSQTVAAFQPGCLCWG